MANTNKEEAIKSTSETPKQEEKIASKPLKVESKEEDTLKKELEELRAYKANIEAQKKAQQEAAKEPVNVSGSFFGQNVQIDTKKQQSNSDKYGENLMGKGVPKRHE